MRNIRLIWTYFVIAFAAMLAALNYELFVFPNQFAPSGINGICTMIQYISGISVGYLSLVVNIPLAVLVFFKVSKPLAVRSMMLIGLVFIALHKIWLRNIYNRWMKRRYANMAALRASR